MCSEQRSSPPLNEMRSSSRSFSTAWSNGPIFGKAGKERRDKGSEPWLGEQLRTAGAKLWVEGLCLVFLAAVAPLVGCKSPADAMARAQARRISSLQGTYGTYDAEPRRPDGRVDVERLVAELVAIRANTYNFLVWRAASDWEDFKLFLPRARAKGIRVWVTLVPPSESPPHTRQYSEPFRLDYQRWAVEIAKLSVQEPNLAAWSLDDFSYDSKTFTPEYMRQMIEASRRINPRLAFVPCLYYDHITPQLAEKYRPFVDGILFPYRHESGKRNLGQWDTLASELARVRERFGSGVPVFVDVYATRHSQLKDSTAEYVEQVMNIGRRTADGVLIFCHQCQDSSPEKYQVIKDLFNRWASEDAKHRLAGMGVRP